MADYRGQISENVDALIKEGAIPEGMRDQYITLMAADEKVAERFAGMLMRGSDYTRKTQALAEERRTIQTQTAAERAQIAAEQAALRQWESEAKAELSRYKEIADQYPQNQAVLAAYKQKLADYNLLDDTTVPEPQPIASAQPKGEPAVTNQNQLPIDYLKREDAAGAIRDLMVMQGDLQAIAGEHYALFGKPLTENLMQEAMNAGVQNVRQFWESKHNIAGKRAEMEAQTRASEIEKVRAETRAAVLAELAVDPSRVMGQPNYANQASQLFDTYASRALASTPDGSVKPLRDVAPELRPDMAASQDRVNRAMEGFMKDFNADGSPRHAGGPAQ